MSVHLIGLNHRTAPVALREQLAFSTEGVATALMLFRRQYPNAEAAILSTCNRVEMVVTSETDSPDIEDMIRFIAQARDLPVRDFDRELYRFSDHQAVRQMFRVASGMDSMVLGEYQIAGQMKTAYAQASEQGTTGPLLNKLFHHAFHVSKRIRTETEICSGKTSIPAVAVDIAGSIFSDFSEKQILVLGAGEMARLVCEHLRDADAQHFTITSRTLNNARNLANACNGKAVPFAQMEDELTHADILIAATACPKHIITSEKLKPVMKQRNRRPMFVIDLAVPRNVAEDVEKVGQVYVYDVDKLGKIVNENRAAREMQLTRCEEILDEELGRFMQVLSENQTKPVIAQMYDNAQQLKELELAKVFNSCPELSEAQRNAVRLMAERLTGKFMHPCVQTMREHGISRPTATLANSFGKLVPDKAKTKRKTGR